LRLGSGRSGGTVFGVVGVLNSFDKSAGEIAEIFAILFAGLLHKEELAEVAEGGGAAVGDAVRGKGAEDDGESGVHLGLRGRIIGERFQVNVVVVLGGGRLPGFLELAMGAAEAIKFTHGRETAVAAIGVFKQAKVEVGVRTFRSHGASLLLRYIVVKL